VTGPRSGPRVLFWRRIDVPGLERLVLTEGDDGILAESTVLCTEDGGFRIDVRWELDASWRALAVAVRRENSAGTREVRLDRRGVGWLVDGAPRPDLDGAAEPDLSITPFCNTFPIRRTPHEPAEGLPLDTAYIDGPTLSVTRSRQRYDRIGPGRVRYVDLGLALGFEADLEVDDDGLVLRYGDLWERIPAGALPAGAPAPSRSLVR
jgi:hypothetical protein